MKQRLLNIHTHPLTSCYLESAFVLENDSALEEYFVIPNGMIGIYIIVNGEGYHYYDGLRHKLPPVVVYGLINKRHLNSMSPHYKIIGFRFKPESLQLFLKERIADFKIKAASLNDLLPYCEAEYLYENVLSARNEIDIIEAFNTFLKRNMQSEKIDNRVVYSLCKIRKGEVNNIETLSRDLNISSTSLRTIFNNNVGIAPKELIRIHRLQKVLKMKTGDEENLTQVAYSLGYYDQSHFIHEFKGAFGITPLKYFSNNNLAYDFYNFERWRLNSFVP